MDCDKNKLQSNIRVLDIIIKNIKRGLGKESPIDYIMAVYGIDMRTAAEICKLDDEDIKLMTDYIDNNTDINEESTTTFFTDNKISNLIIDYVLDRKPETSTRFEFTVKIKGDNKLIFHTPGARNSHNLFCHQESSVKTNYYTIRENQIIFNSEKTMVPIIRNYSEICKCRSPNIIEYIDDNGFVFGRQRICIKSSDKIFNFSKCNCRCSLFNLDKARYARIWFPEEDYDTDYKYLIFYSRHCLIVDQTINIGKTSKDNVTIKIPLIDGLRMKTPLGHVSVKRTRTMDEYQAINRWSDDDFDIFSQ